MARRASVDEMIDRVAALRHAPIDDAAIALLTEALASRTGLVAAKAAAVVREKGLTQLQPALIAAFERFMAGGDKGCLGKTALAEALYELGADAGPLFLRGARHVQKEPAFGGPVDAGAELRGICALGLARCGHPKAFEVLADLLADPEVQVRVMAARALGYLGHDHGALLLRLRVRVGDPEDEVIGECLQQILRLAPDSFDFVAGYLDDPSEGIRQAAALALASTRRAEALELLTSRWEHALADRSVLALAIATHRSPAAIEFLLDRLAEEDRRTAGAIVETMRMYDRDESVCSRVRAIAHDRGLAVE